MCDIYLLYRDTVIFYLVGIVLFLNVFKILEKKDIRYVLNKFWNVAETCFEIEYMTLYLLHI